METIRKIKILDREFIIKVLEETINEQYRLRRTKEVTLKASFLKKVDQFLEVNRPLFDHHNFNNKSASKLRRSRKMTDEDFKIIIDESNKFLKPYQKIMRLLKTYNSWVESYAQERKEAQERKARQEATRKRNLELYGTETSEIENLFKELGKHLKNRKYR